MADSFWFWSNVSPMEQEDIERGGRRGYDIDQGQKQEKMMMRKKSTVIRFEDDEHHQNTTSSGKKTKGKLSRKKPEKKIPKRGVGIAKLEETIKQKNAQLPPAADHPRQVHHGYPTTTEVAAASVLPTPYNQSQPQSQFHHQIHPQILHHQQQKKTSTVSSLSFVHGADGGHLNLNHVPNDDGGYHDQVINYNGGYNQIINYGSASTNVNGGGHAHQQPYVNLLHPSKQQQQRGNSTTYNVAGYNPSSGSGFLDQHGNNNGFYSPPKAVVELSSTQKQQNYDHHFPPQQHSHDHIPLDYQKNLNNHENIGGFTPYSKTNITAQITDSKSADFLKLDLGRKYKDSKAAAAGFLRAGYSGLTNEDQVELLAVHRKGKSSSSSVLMEYEFLSLTNGAGIKGHHQFHTNKEYEPHYSSNYNSSSSSCVMEESAASSAAFRNGSFSSSSQISNSDRHEFLDLSLKLSSYH